MDGEGPQRRGAGAAGRFLAATPVKEFLGGRQGVEEQIFRDILRRLVQVFVVELSAQVDEVRTVEGAAARSRSGPPEPAWMLARVVAASRTSIAARCG